jgi:EF hand
MKIRILTCGIILATGIGAKSQEKFPASSENDRAAEMEERPAGRREARKPPRYILEQFDYDEDGKLNQEELQAALEGHRLEVESSRKPLLKRYDKDRNGKLSQAEDSAARAEMQARQQRLVEKYDADKDGRLNVNERRIAVEAGEELPPLFMVDSDALQAPVDRPEKLDPNAGQPADSIFDENAPDE